MLGVFRDNARTRMEFLELIKLRSAVPGSSSAADLACVDEDCRAGWLDGQDRLDAAQAGRAGPCYTDTMRRLLVVRFIALAAIPVFAQTRRPARRPAPPPPPALKKAVPEMVCPTPLGTGVNTKLTLLRRDDAAAIPRTGS